MAYKRLDLKTGDLLDTSVFKHIDDAIEALNTMPSEVVNIAVTANIDGNVTIVNTLNDGSQETVVIIADSDGNPATLIYNGTEIPITWTEAS